MSYSTSNPPVQIGQSVGGEKGQLWLYHSTDVHTDVDAVDYFSNASALGMKAGDVVIVVETDNTYALSMHVVTSVTAGGAGTVAARVTA